MSIKLITGNSGTDHITASDDGALYAGIISPARVVLSDSFKCEVISNNLIRLKSGVLSNQGRIITIEQGDYEDLIIDNGSQALNRNDIIAIRYEMNEQTKIETATAGIIKGIPAKEAVDPEVEKGDILSGDTIDEFPLYRIKLEGLNIVAVEPMFDVIVPMKELQDRYDELNSNLIDVSGEVSTTHAAVSELKNKWSSLTATTFGTTILSSAGPHFTALYYKHTNGSYGWALILSYSDKRPVFVRLHGGIWYPGVYV